MNRSAAPGPRSGILLVLMFAVTACGARGEHSTASPPPDPGADVPATATRPDTATESEVTDELHEFVLDGEQRLAEGDPEGAIEAFQGYLAFDGTGDQRARALWGLSLAYLAPESQALDPERGMRTLRVLADNHPLSLQGRLAQWLHGLVVELEEARAVASEQAALVDQLTEMVEQLRQIDLNRRPGGAPPDSLRRSRNR